MASPPPPHSMPIVCRLALPVLSKDELNKELLHKGIDDKMIFGNQTCAPIFSIG
jgi:hypothetical protein